MNENEHYTKVIAAGIIIFRRAKGQPRFLLLYRDRGTWDFPRGRMEGGERSWQTAFREVAEETGLQRSEVRMLPNFKVYERFPYSRGKKPILKIIIFYLGETYQPRVRLSVEHAGYGWFSYHEARRLLARYPARIHILRQALTQIRTSASVTSAGSESESRGV